MHIPISAIPPDKHRALLAIGVIGPSVSRLWFLIALTLDKIWEHTFACRTRVPESMVLRPTPSGVSPIREVSAPTSLAGRPGLCANRLGDTFVRFGLWR
jgi:hypothetical protein